MSYTKGIDISHWQGTIDWGKVSADGVTFAFQKATESDYYQDDTCEANWAGMKAQNMVCGVYHFFKASKEYELQVANLIGMLGKLDFDKSKDYVAIDVETNDTTTTFLTENLWNMLTDLDSKGYKVIIYTAKYFWDDNVLFNNHDFTKYGLWVASWTSASEPYYPGKWTDWVVWQYTDQGSVSGIAGNVDMDRMKA